jgi:hypothetical protein
MFTLCIYLFLFNLQFRFEDCIELDKCKNVDEWGVSDGWAEGNVENSESKCR